MELVIGICDDYNEQIKLIRRYLDKYNQQFDLRVISSVDSEVFLSKIKDKKPALVFLDIDMEGLNGIELGEKIKEESENTIIVYITAYEKYALKAFQVRAFHYLIKPLTEEKFYQVFKEAVELLKKDVKDKTDIRIFTVQNKDEIISLNYNDIFYFEKEHHKIKVYTGDRIIEFYGSFKNLLHEIDSEFFIRCHQGYIVNKDKIRVYKDKTLIMGGYIQIPVSRSNINKIKGILAERLFNGED